MVVVSYPINSPHRGTQRSPHISKSSPLFRDPHSTPVATDHPQKKNTTTIIVNQHIHCPENMLEMQNVQAAAQRRTGFSSSSQDMFHHITGLMSHTLNCVAFTSPLPVPFPSRTAHACFAHALMHGFGHVVSAKAATSLLSFPFLSFPFLSFPFLSFRV